MTVDTPATFGLPTAAHRFAHRKMHMIPSASEFVHQIPVLNPNDLDG
jgi:hypothetical protein